MDFCASLSRKDERKHAISWLLFKICTDMEREDTGATYEPILTGSAAECTQTLFIDEFDYVLLAKSTKDDYVMQQL